MSETWRQEYIKLTEYISNHPEIVINRDGFSTPEESRAGFYTLFNAVLTALTGQFFQVIIKESEPLTKTYAAVAAETKALFSIDNAKALAEFYRFLDNPGATIAMAAFNPLFDRLQGKVSEDVFEQTAKQAIASLSHDLRATVYEKWIMLSLVKLLRTDEIYECSQIRARNFRLEKFMRLDNQHPAVFSAPVKTNQLSWEFDREPILTQPDCILRACAGGKHKYVAIRSNFRMGTHRAKTFPEGGEWVSVRDNFTLNSDIILIYSSDNLTDFALVAERGKVCRPELVIKYLENNSVYSDQWLEDAREADAILQPNSGFFIVSKAPVALLEQDKLGDYIHFLEVGFDQSKLAPIIDALLTHESALNAQSADTPSVP